MGYLSEEERMYMVQKIIKEKESYIRHLKKQRDPWVDNKPLEEKIKEAEDNLNAYIKTNLKEKE